MGSSEELDPLAELRESLERPATSVEAVIPPPGSGMGVSAPPPLPPRRSLAVPTAVPPTRAPVPSRPTGAAPAFRPAMSLPSVQLPIRSSDFPPEAPSRPASAADPFGEPLEPRMSLGSALEEKVEHFRLVLRQKAETLARARSLYEEREMELQTIRISESALRGQVRELTSQRDHVSTALARESERAAAAEAQRTQLQGELQRVEADRQDLSRALAEVEVELTALTGQLGEERESRGGLAEELIGAKEALSLAQDRVAELVAERVELQGALEAVQEQYQGCLVELEHIGEELRTAVRERELLGAERTGFQARVTQLEASLAESEWSSSSLAEAQTHTRELEEALEAARAEQTELTGRLEGAEAEVVRLRDQMEADSVALGEAAEIAEARVAQLESDVEAAQGELRELRAQKEREAAEHEELGVEELDTGAQVREAEEQAERLRQRLKMLEGALETSRNRTATLEVEVAARSSLEAQVAELQGTLELSRDKVTELEAEVAVSSTLEDRVTELEAELAAARAQPSESNPPSPVPSSGAEPSAELLAENEQLKADLVAMKRKLMAAETALESAASYKMKVARLEAQLAQLKGGK